MATIEEDYVSFEAAKLLKEKGFPQSAFRCHYIIDGNSHYKSFENRCGFGDYDIIAPTLAMAMKWLREVHNIYIDINTNWAFKDDGFIVVGYMFNTHSTINSWYQDLVNYPTYEKACEAAVLYCLEKLI